MTEEEFIRDMADPDQRVWLTRLLKKARKQGKSLADAIQEEAFGNLKKGGWTLDELVQELSSKVLEESRKSTILPSMATKNKKPVKIETTEKLITKVGVTTNNGSEVFLAQFTTGHLPQFAEGGFQHGIKNILEVIKVEGKMFRDNGLGECYPLPFADSVGQNVSLIADAKSVFLAVGSTDRSAFRAKIAMLYAVKPQPNKKKAVKAPDCCCDCKCEKEAPKAAVKKPVAKKKNNH
jgi:hypothetical protein